MCDVGGAIAIGLTIIEFGLLVAWHAYRRGHADQTGFKVKSESGCQDSFTDDELDSLCLLTWGLLLLTVYLSVTGVRRERSVRKQIRKLEEQLESTREDLAGEMFYNATYGSMEQLPLVSKTAV